MSHLIRCGLGLGNRVAAIANGLSRWPEIRFVWRDNTHCPATHQEIFPGGIAGVEFVTDSPPASASCWDGHRCQEWAAAGVRTAATAAYQTIMLAMTGAARMTPHVAILARFHRWPETTPASLAIRAAVAGGGAPVFVLADSRRREIAAELKKLGIGSVLPVCGELAADLQRPPSDLLEFISDWKTALAAKVLTGHPESSLFYPARA